MLERRGRRQPLTLQSLGTIASASLTQLRTGWAGGSGRRERGRGVQSAYARKVTEWEGQRLKTTGPIDKPAPFRASAVAASSVRQADSPNSKKTLDRFV